MLASPGPQQLSSCSSRCPRMKCWTDCCDQLFPGFKTLRLWVAQQCRSSTPPPTSHRGRHVAASDLDSRRGGNKCTLRGGKSADQNRPPVCCLLSKTADRAAKRTGKLAPCLRTVRVSGKCWRCLHLLHKRLWRAMRTAQQGILAGSSTRMGTSLELASPNTSAAHYMA